MVGLPRVWLIGQGDYKGGRDQGQIITVRFAIVSRTQIAHCHGTLDGSFNPEPVDQGFLGPLKRKSYND
jgi:hypothetical protein